MEYYLALHKATDNFSEEVLSGDYQRLKIIFDFFGEFLINSDPIIFPMALKNWGIVKSFSLHQDSDNSNILYSGLLDNPIEVLEGTIVAFPSEFLKISILKLPAQFKRLIFGKTLWEYLLED
jgi:hypothetical protein